MQVTNTIQSMLSSIDEPNSTLCFRLLECHGERFSVAWGSSHNHQAYEGGYLEHVRATMRIATDLYPAMSSIDILPFSLSDALLVLFLHDIEKPWKKDFPKDFSKPFRAMFRRHLLIDAGIGLTSEQQNALAYVEGEGDDYRSDKRVMNELAAFCHMCDVASARIWWS